MSPQIPSTLCDNWKQRMGAFALVDPDDLQRGIIEIIPRELLLINFHGKIKNGIHKIKSGRERNIINFIACRNLRITAIEFIAHAASRYVSNKFSQNALFQCFFFRGRPKGSEYTDNLQLTIEKTTDNSRKIILYQKHICSKEKVESPFLHNLHKILNVEKGSKVSISVVFQRGSLYQNFFTGCVGADLPKNRVIRFNRNDILANHYNVQHEREFFKIMCISKWLTIPRNKSISIFRCVHFQFL
jgi:hypothetical protein